MNRTNSSALDLLTATPDEVDAAMRRGVRAALRRHKAAGVPAIVWDDETGKIVSVPPEQIPDFPEDDDESERLPDQS